MKGIKLRLSWLSVGAALLSMVPGTKADFFYQPPTSSIEPEWRNAGSVFLEGIAEIMSGLSGLEKGEDPTSVRSEMAKATLSLQKARELYQGIQSRIGRPRRIDFDKVPPKRVLVMRGLFEHYERKLPSDEGQAAFLAGEEALQLAQALERDKERFGRYELDNFRALITQVTRALQFGTALAELMKYGLVES
jgi:hypothetical protein